MLTETQKMQLTADLITNVSYSYNSEDFNPSIYVFRKGEPVSKKYPAVMIDFLPVAGQQVGGMNNLVSTIQGKLMYGYGELEPIIISVFTDQKCEGTSNAYHGRIIADTYIRRIEERIRREFRRR